MKLEIKLGENAKLPKKGSDEAAGFDVYADGDYFLPPWEVSSKPTVVGTSIQTQFPKGYVALLADRSGLASKGITTKIPWDVLRDFYRKYGEAFATFGGVIDSDYRGEWKVLLINFSSEAYQIKKGERIAQFLILKLEEVEVEIVETLELSDSSRGSGGFGSTGK